MSLDKAHVVAAEVSRETAGNIVGRGSTIDESV